MDIATQTEIILRDASYDTWAWAGPLSVPVTCFENAAIVGFVFAFPTIAELLSGWAPAQEAALRRHAISLRAAGPKAWNVYCIFLTAEADDGRSRQVERLDEDFAHSRKIARVGVQTRLDLERALLSLLTIRSRSSLGATDFEVRLRSRLKDLPADALNAFIGETKADEIARILGADT